MKLKGCAHAHFSASSPHGHWWPRVDSADVATCKIAELSDPSFANWQDSLLLFISVTLNAVQWTNISSSRPQYKNIVAYSGILRLGMRPVEMSSPGYSTYMCIKDIRCILVVISQTIVYLCLIYASATQQTICITSCFTNCFSSSELLYVTQQPLSTNISTELIRPETLQSVESGQVDHLLLYTQEICGVLEIHLQLLLPPSAYYPLNCSTYIGEVNLRHLQPPSEPTIYALLHMSEWIMASYFTSNVTYFMSRRRVKIQHTSEMTRHIPLWQVITHT